MIRVRQGGDEQLLTLAAFEAATRRGEIGPHDMVCAPALLGDRFVPARTLPMFQAVYDARLVNFRRHFRLWRVPWLTLSLLVLFTGVHLFVYDASDAIATRAALVRYGAKATARLIEAGESWRLLAANVLHRSHVHFGLNMLALWPVGMVLEGLYRRADLIAVLVAAGLGTMGLSAVMSPGMTVGASGLIFAMLGLACVFAARYWRWLPLRARALIGGGMGVYAALAFGLGLMSPRSDNWGHVGGLIVGVLSGLVLVPRLLSLRTPKEALRRRAVSIALAGVMAGAVIALGPLFQRPTGMSPLHADDAGVVFQRPSHWTGNAEPAWFVEYENGVDAFAIFGCSKRAAPIAQDAAVRQFIAGDLRALADGRTIRDLEVGAPQPHRVRTTAGDTRMATRIPVSLTAKTGPFSGVIDVLARGTHVCVAMMAFRPDASRGARQAGKDALDATRVGQAAPVRRAEAAVARAPADAAAWLALADAQYALGAFTAAHTAAQTAHALAADDSRSAAALATLAEVALAQNLPDPELALSWAREAHALSHAAPRRAITLAKVLKARGRPGAAADVLEHAMVRHPDATWLRPHIQGLRALPNVAADVVPGAAHGRGAP